jgi:hypothetical protein
MGLLGFVSEAAYFFCLKMINNGYGNQFHILMINFFFFDPKISTFGKTAVSY